MSTFNMKPLANSLGMDFKSQTWEHQDSQNNLSPDTEEETAVDEITPPAEDENEKDIDAPEAEIGEEGLETVDTEAKPSVDWNSSAARYEWNEEYGDVAPRIPEMEEILFGDVHLRGSTGLEFNRFSEQKVPYVNNVSIFGEAGLHPVMLDNVRLSGYSVPTPIQQYCIPAIQAGHDVLACAQTGSGKTAAFLIPILSKLMGKAKKLAAPRPKGHCPGYRAEPLVLILAPTRELATQIFDESRRFCYRTMLRPCVIYGGAEFNAQRIELEKGCDLLVATPGRLMDFLDRNRSLSLKRVRYAVVDEADEMLDMGFAPQIRNFFINGDMNRDDDLQITMFSATYPAEIQNLAREFLADGHVRLAVGRIGSTHRNITQRILYVEDSEKKDALHDMLIHSPPTRTLIFANQKGTVDTLDQFLYDAQFPCTSIHSARTQREREDALRAFRTGRCPILVATSVASRGLDIKNVMHVINYDAPQDINEYVHRIGRTARIGNKGLATTFYNDSNDKIAKDLVMLLAESEQEIPDFLERYKEQAEAEKAAMRVDEFGVPIPNSTTSGSGSWGTEDSATDAPQGNADWGKGKEDAPVSNETWPPQQESTW
ncbi:P-loop containing nucleoside triphosphate hydrolase protein [Peziza echinospora]|nr:P-loop containing nucleoside triphosphate hydrolase protein [Peziza echinospora]